MQGSLGIGANLNKWTPEEFAKAKQMITAYNAIRETIQRGSLYRLITPEDNSEQSVTETISRDGNQVVTFAFLHSSTELYPFPRIHLRGLDEGASYTISTIAGSFADGTPTTASGAYWMHHGLDIKLYGDFQAMAFTLARAKQSGTAAIK